MQIELIPNKDQYTVKLKCSEGGFTTEYSVSRGTEIGNAMRFAVENHYKQVASARIHQLLGGVY